jgi:hypothetical protein
LIDEAKGRPPKPEKVLCEVLTEKTGKNAQRRSQNLSYQKKQKDDPAWNLDFSSLGLAGFDSILGALSANPMATIYSLHI